MKAAIFDFDGTIADSCYVWEAVDKSFFEKRNMEIPFDYTQKISTLNMRDGAIFTKNEYNLPDSIDDIIKEWQQGAVNQYKHNVALKPFAAEYIRDLRAKGIRLALATAASPEFYTPVLKRNGILDIFDVIIDGASGMPSKDYPDIFIHCARLLNTNAKDCCVYEDILPAIKSANRAGMYTTAVFEPKSRNDWDKIKAAANKSIISFAELL